MFIYTGNASGKKLDNVERLGMGCMVASSATWKPSADLGRVRCALDNGAFQCWRRGFPFMADVFRSSIAECYRVGLELDFIVCPDIVGGGYDSLAFSMSWAMGELVSAPRLALAVQDGMGTRDINHTHAQRFSHLFIGGTVDWKWKNAASWVSRAHDLGMKCHIGQVGTLNRLRFAKKIGADSVDSTSFARNDSWHIIEEFLGGKQEEMFLCE